MALWCVACTPALNWRETVIPGAAVSALLPCEPDHARRSVPLGGVPTELAMAGCEAGGATFAIMVAEAPAGQAGALLAGWRKATLSNMHAEDIQEEAFLPKGALNLPESIRLGSTGKRADGRPVYAQATWAARIAPGGTHAQLVHLVMYSERRMPDAADAFFAGLRLQ